MEGSDDPDVPGTPKSQPAEEISLEDAIDALLSEVDASCARFEAPEVDEAEEEAQRAMLRQAGVKVESKPTPEAPDGGISAGGVEASAESASVEHAPEGSDVSADVAIEAEAAEEHVGVAGDAPADGTPALEDATTDAGAEAALDAVEASASELLEQAANDLVESLEAIAEPTAGDTGVEPVEPEDAAGDETDAIDEIGPDVGVGGSDGGGELEVDLESVLDDAVRDLLSRSHQNIADELMAGTMDPAEDDASGSDAEAPTDPLAGDTIDALLDGSFESADGETVEDDASGTAPDPALSLTADRVAANLMEPGSEGVAGAPREEAGSAEPEPDIARVGAPVAPSAAEPVAVPGFGRVAPESDGPAWRRVLLRVSAVAGRLGAHGARAAGPIGARALVLMSKPLEKHPVKVRDSVGWVALWTVFLALCVWGYVLMRPPVEQPGDGKGSTIATVEPTPGGAPGSAPGDATP